MENREDFYADEFDKDRMNKMLNDVAKTLTLKEALMLIRNICWDMVYYNDKEDCGIIYKDDKYSEENRWQACQLQRLVSTACDLFGQSVINHREFDMGYLNKYLNGGALELEVERLKNEIESLKKRMDEV